jgi:Na+-driven multidrug efflux pump
MQDLTQGSVIRHLLHMAAFLTVSMLVQTLYLLADLYWVGRLGRETIVPRFAIPMRPVFPLHIPRPRQRGLARAQ